MYRPAPHSAGSTRPPATFLSFDTNRSLPSSPVCAGSNYFNLYHGPMWPAWPLQFSSATDKLAVCWSTLLLHQVPQPLLDLWKTPRLPKANHLVSLHSLQNSLVWHEQVVRRCDDFRKESRMGIGQCYCGGSSCILAPGPASPPSSASCCSIFNRYRKVCSN